MLKVILKFAPEPGEHEMNSSAMHVDSVMNNKVSPQSVLIELDRCGRRTVAILNSTPDVWKKHLWKEWRIVDACLYGESLSVALALSQCLRFSRKVFEHQISIVRSRMETTENRQVLITTPMPPASRKSQSMLLSSQHKPPSIVHRSVIRTSSTYIDWKEKMVEMLLDVNREAVRAVSSFLSDYNTRRASPKPAPAALQKQSKADRAKLYESFGAVSPLRDPEDEDDIPPLPLKTLRDIRSDWFARSTTLVERVCEVHCCLVIQRAVRLWLIRQRERHALVVQCWFRMIEARKAVTQLRLLPFKRVYYLERLRHWLKLLAGQRRLRKDKTQIRTTQQYLSEMPKILLLQKAVRGFIVRRTVVPLEKFCHEQRMIHKCSQERAVKIASWQRCRHVEAEMLKNACALAEQLQYFHHTHRQGKKIKGFKTDKDLTNYVRSIEKAEAKDRRSQLRTVAEIRVRALKT